MNIVWFTWKDIKNPHAGGAEQISSEIAKRLVSDGHKVTILTSSFPGASRKEKIDGYEVVRAGNRFTVYFYAAVHFLKHHRSSTDFIIEEINTIPFMTQLYSRKKRVLVIYQLCREIWFYQMFFPLNLVGYILEPLYLFLLKNNWVITESRSTKIDLQKYGFRKKQIHIIPVFTDIKLSIHEKKFSHPTILSLGSIRSMKRTLDQVQAFELAKKEIPELKLIIAGDYSSRYGRKVYSYIKKSPYKNDVSILGRITRSKKTSLLRKSHILLVTSVKEGWGLIVTEAATQGTPTIGYNIDGLRDSITAAGGMIIYPSTMKMAKSIVKLIREYKNVNQSELIITTKHLSPANSYKVFIASCKKVHASL
jgi:glycosyltransferase involved in cell wall biosynthesis